MYSEYFFFSLKHYFIKLIFEKWNWINADLRHLRMWGATTLNTFNGILISSFYCVCVCVVWKTKRFSRWNDHRERRVKNFLIFLDLWKSTKFGNNNNSINGANFTPFSTYDLYNNFFRIFTFSIEIKTKIFLSKLN